MESGGIADEDCSNSSDCDAECSDEATSALDVVDYRADRTNYEQALAVISGHHDSEVVIHLPACSSSSQHAPRSSDPLSPYEDFPVSDLVYPPLSADRMTEEPFYLPTDQDYLPINSDCMAPHADNLLPNPDIGPMGGVNFDWDSTPLAGTREEADDETTILNVIEDDETAINDAMHIYLRMLLKAHHESTQVVTVMVHDLTFWALAKKISKESTRGWKQLTDGRVLDPAALRTVLIPWWNQDHWQLFIIDRDLRMIRFYCPRSGTPGNQNKEVSSKIDITNLPF